MSNSVALALNIIARDKASKTLTTVGTNAEKTKGKLGRLGTGGKVALASVATATAAFGKKSIDTYTNVGKETLKLQRYLGGTAEEASRLRFAAQQSGVGTDDLAKGIGLLSKNLAAAKDKTKTVTTHVAIATGEWRKQTTVVKNAAGEFVKIEKMVPVTKMETLSKVVKVANPLLAQLGIAARDSHGHLRPMSDLLPEIAEKFKGMPAGTEKTALALKLFGRNGMTLLPFLNKGADGIKELAKESDRLGNTLSGKDLQAVKDNTKAKREWHAAVMGVQIQLGRNLFPILTKGAVVLARVSAFVERNGKVTKPVIAIVAALAIGLKVLAVSQQLVNFAMEANPIGLVIVGLVALTAGLVYAYKHSEKFRKIVQGAMHGAAAAVDFVRDHWKAFATGLALLVGGPVLGAVVLLVTHFGKVKSAAAGVWDWVKGHWPQLLMILTGPVGAAVVLVVKNFGAIKAAAVTVFRAVGGAASAMWTGVIRPVFKFFIDAWFAVVGALVHGAAAAFGWVPGIGGKLKNAAKQFDAFRDKVNASLDGIKDKEVKINVTLAAGGAGKITQGRGGKLAVDTGGNQVAVPGKVIPAAASGAIVMATPGGTLVQVGEGGQDEAIIPLPRGARGAAAGGDTYYIDARGAAAGAGREIVAAIRRYKRESGGGALGIA